MKWFKHYTSASDDFKILALERKFGLTGYAYFWKTLEFVAGLWSGYGEPEIETTLDQYRKELKTQGPKLKKVMDCMSELELMQFTVDGEKLTIRIENLKKIKDNASSAKTSSRGLTLELKDYIVQRDSNQCVYCDETLLGQSLNFDHFIPVSLGGENGPHNIVLSCEKCNHAKHMKHPDEFGKMWSCGIEGIEKIRKKLALELDKETEKEKELAANKSLVGKTTGKNQNDAWIKEAEVYFQARRLYHDKLESFNSFLGDDRIRLLKAMGGKKFLMDLKDNGFDVKRLATLIEMNSHILNQTQESA